MTLLDHDEHVRPESTMQSLAALEPAFAKMGKVAGFDEVAVMRYPEVEQINHVHHAGQLVGDRRRCGRGSDRHQGSR